MTQILRFPSERICKPGLPRRKQMAEVHLLFNQFMFEKLMRSLGWKLTPHQNLLTAPPKFPALPYYPQG